MSEITSGRVLRGLPCNRIAFKSRDVDKHKDEINTTVYVTSDNTSSSIRQVFNDMDKAKFPGGYAESSVERIRQKGGQLRHANSKDCPSEYRLLGLTLCEANNLFYRRHLWPPG